MKITVLTLFPQWFAGPLGESIIARAQAAGLVTIDVVQLRDFANNKHNTVDDTPYGGGGGMVLKPEPVAAALDTIAGPPGAPDRARVLFPSPRGARWTHADALDAAASQRDIVFLCGHYEGLDERILQTRVDAEVSLGDFVLTGGEIPTMAFVDSIVRLIPGALGAPEGAVNDSFATGLLEGPQYTRPEMFDGLPVPEILRSGNHAAVAKWRLEQSLEITRARRPDLYEAWIAAHPPKEPKRRRRKEKPPPDTESGGGES